MGLARTVRVRKEALPHRQKTALNLMVSQGIGGRLGHHLLMQNETNGMFTATYTYPIKVLYVCVLFSFLSMRFGLVALIVVFLTHI